MRSLVVVIMHKVFNPFASAPSTAHPRVMETVNAHFECVKPLFDLSRFEYLNPMSGRHVRPDDRNGSYPDTAFF